MNEEDKLIQGVKDALLNYVTYLYDEGFAPSVVRTEIEEYVEDALMLRTEKNYG